MKERLTYIIRDPTKSDFDPSTLAISGTSLAFTAGIDAAKEHQVTVGLGELKERVRIGSFVLLDHGKDISLEPMTSSKAHSIEASHSTRSYSLCLPRLHESVPDG
jgi:hypothetical protein